VRCVAARSVWTGRTPLSEADPELSNIIKQEKKRQVMGLELIASEVTLPFIYLDFH